MTIQETHFFRVTPQIEALRRHVLPALLRRRQDAPAERRLSIWSAGCSTGEEPYTLAILLREELPRSSRGASTSWAQTSARRRWTRARRARYGDWSFRDTPPEIRQRYFVPEGKHWRLVEPVRRLVRFARHNLVADPFPTVPGGFDLILYRNVTIYFSPQTTQRLYHHFAEALAPGGWLLLGPSDSPPVAPARLEPCYLNGAILWRRRADGPRRRRRRRRRPAGDATPGRRPRAGDAARASGRPHRAAAAPDRSGAPQPSGRPARSRYAGRGSAAVATAARRRPAGAPASWPTLLATTAPLDAEVHLVRGLLLLDEGEPERALEVLRRAAFLAPDNALAQVSLGRAYHQLGTRERARAALSRARRILAPLPAADARPRGRRRHRRRAAAIDRRPLRRARARAG